MTDQQQPPKRRGRPELADEERAKPVTMRLDRDDRETWNALGGAGWLRPILARERRRMQRLAGARD